MPDDRKERRVAIVQSNYIPWKGYFDLMARVDDFVLLDDAQYTRRDWRNRNRIKTPDGTRWLTIPVEVKGRYEQRIDETRVSDPTWARSHWKTLTHAYARAAHFADLAPVVEGAYEACADLTHLSEINAHFLQLGRDLLGLETRLSRSRDYEGSGRRTERLVEICHQLGATRYLSGPSARDYLEESAFLEIGVEVEWMSYEGYRPYEQVHPPFEHAVTVLDLLFHTGREARSYLLTERTR